MKQTFGTFKNWATQAPGNPPKYWTYAELQKLLEMGASNLKEASTIIIGKWWNWNFILCSMTLRYSRITEQWLTKICLDPMTFELVLLGKLTWNYTNDGYLSSILPIVLVEPGIWQSVLMWRLKSNFMYLNFSSRSLVLRSYWKTLCCPKLFLIAKLYTWQMVYVRPHWYLFIICSPTLGPLPASQHVVLQAPKVSTVEGLVGQNCRYWSEVVASKILGFVYQNENKEILERRGNKDAKPSSIDESSPFDIGEQSADDKMPFNK